MVGQIYHKKNSETIRERSWSWSIWKTRKYIYDEWHSKHTWYYYL